MSTQKAKKKRGTPSAKTNLAAGSGRVFRHFFSKVPDWIRNHRRSFSRSELITTAKNFAFRGLCLLVQMQGKLRARRVIVYYICPDYALKAGALADLLARRGFDVEIRSGLSRLTRAMLKSGPDLWIGYWNWFPTYWLPKHYIFLNAEPLNIKEWGENGEWIKAIKGARQVWGYTRTNADYIHKLGVPFRFTPFGYTPYFEATFQKTNQGKKLVQDIDVIFFGSLSERRTRMLDELKGRGMNVHIVSPANPAHGTKLDELLIRSKIVLGIHGYDEPQAQIADFARVDRLLSNRLFVVHEKPSMLASDFAFEQNVTTCKYDDIPDTCAYFLVRPEERTTKADKAHEWFKSEYLLDKFIPYGDVHNLLKID